MTKINLRNAVLAATLAPAGIAPPALAQSGVTALEEVVVTAQRRQQSVQDVPISIEAFSSDQIDDYRINNLIDLGTLVPNLSAVEGSGGTRSVLFQIRGLYASGTALAADSGVAIYLDGVYLPGGSGGLTNYADLERIEVLRGPQGTLFGRNTSGGAISFITPDPDGEFGFKQTFTAGNFDLFESRTRIDTPKWGPISASINYTYQEREGDVDNLGAGFVVDWTNFESKAYESPERLGDSDSDALLVAVDFDLHEDLRLVYKYDYQEVDTSPPPVGILGVADVLAPIVPLIESSIADKRPDAVNNAFHTQTYSEIWGHNLTAEYEISESLSLRNIFAYREGYVEVPGQTLDGIGQFAPGIVVFFVTGGKETEQTSNETQLIWETDRFTWTNGFLYYALDQEAGGLPDSTAPNAIFGGTPGSFIPGLETGRRSEAETESLAAYTQLEYRLSDQWELVLGGRYTNDKKDYIDRTLPGQELRLDYDESEPTYMVGANWLPTEDILLYAKYSIGYISGGLVSGLEYDPEMAKSFEVGGKATWLQGRLRTNIALFSVDYEDQQFGTAGNLVDPPVAASQVLVNAGDTEAQGVEFEASWVPITNTTLGMSFGYLDFEFKDIDLALLGGPISPHLRPDWTGTVFGDYVTDPIFGDAQVRFHLDASYRSEEWIATRPTDYVDGTNGDVWRLNGRISLAGIKLAGGEVSVAVWGRNLTDSDLPVNMNTLGPVVAGQYEFSRTYGLDLTFEY
ncbi:TonB-dependent receptor [Parahaliea maris]|uniref:TonB-dependent receptor n=1 Tax=Parahaliea maris TaxID=2716870 RepID=UPI001650B0FB|nr:TonB-dependent receptor [Parahaliea maris]